MGKGVLAVHTSKDGVEGKQNCYSEQQRSAGNRKSSDNSNNNDNSNKTVEIDADSSASLRWPIGLVWRHLGQNRHQHKTYLKALL